MYVVSHCYIYITVLILILKLALLTVGAAYGLGVVLALTVVSSTSGGHLNPCVTIAFTIFKGFPIRKVPRYVGVGFSIVKFSLIFTLFPKIHHFSNSWCIRSLFAGIPPMEGADYGMYL